MDSERHLLFLGGGIIVRAIFFYCRPIDGTHKWRRRVKTSPAARAGIEPTCQCLNRAVSSVHPDSTGQTLLSYCQRGLTGLFCIAGVGGTTAGMRQSARRHGQLLTLQDHSQLQCVCMNLRCCICAKRVRCWNVVAHVYETREQIHEADERGSNALHYLARFHGHRSGVSDDYHAQCHTQQLQCRAVLMNVCPIACGR